MDAGRDLPEAIDRCQYPSVSWLEDNKSFVYTRLQEVGPSDPPTAKYLDSQALLHKLGKSPDKDVLVILGLSLALHTIRVKLNELRK